MHKMEDPQECVAGISWQFLCSSALVLEQFGPSLCQLAG